MVELNKSVPVSGIMTTGPFTRSNCIFCCPARNDWRLQTDFGGGVGAWRPIVPVVLSSVPSVWVGRMFLASIFSFGVVALSLESVYGFGSSGRGYKTAEDEITARLNLFQLRAEPHGASCTDPEKLLVMRVEGIILKERKDTLENSPRGSGSWISWEREIDDAFQRTDVKCQMLNGNAEQPGFCIYPLPSD